MHNGSFHSRCRILLEKDDFKSSCFGLQIIHEIDVISENIEKMTLLFSMQQTRFENERAVSFSFFKHFKAAFISMPQSNERYLSLCSNICNHLEKIYFVIN